MKHLLIGASFLSLYLLSRFFLRSDLITITSFFLFLPFFTYEIYSRVKDPSDELLTAFTILLASIPFVGAFLLVLNKPYIAKIGILPFNVSAVWLSSLMAPLLALAVLACVLVRLDSMAKPTKSEMR